MTVSSRIPDRGGFDFNSHPHEEDDYPLEMQRTQGKYFNSHPHEEDDLPPDVIRDACWCISTHILTKRMTIWLQLHRYTFPIFQLTSSRRGWHRGTASHFRTSHFNSHPHEEDDEYAEQVTAEHKVFQLTSSRRGWRSQETAYAHLLYFNSHPHEEDDRILKN